MADPERNVSASPNRFPANAKGFLFPPIAWAVYFVVVYSAQGAGCATGLAEASFLGVSALRIILAAIAVLAAGSIIAVGVWSAISYRRIERENPKENDRVEQLRFLVEGAALNAGLFFVATLWIGLPIAWSGPCGG